MTQPIFTTEELMQQIRHLEAERESLTALITEYRMLCDQKDGQIRHLEARVREGIEEKSQADYLTEEIEYLQFQLDQYKQTAQGAQLRETELNREMGETITALNRTEDIRHQYTHLEAQLTDLQEQVSELSKRNLKYHQQASQIAELESALQVAEETIALWQSRAGQTNA